MRKLLLVLILILSNIISRGQNFETFINDTISVTYLPHDDKILDSIISINDWNKENLEWKVYYDNRKKHLAYESKLIGDTCTRIDYWRNGLIKKTTTYVKYPETDFNWWCEEQYCSNGQLIVKWCPYKFNEKTLITRYYCNSNKAKEWTQFGVGAIGLFTLWYENGQKQSEWYFGENGSEGEWKYWDEKGNLQKTEIYGDGKLQKTIQGK